MHLYPHNKKSNITYKVQHAHGNTWRMSRYTLDLCSHYIMNIWRARAVFYTYIYFSRIWKLTYSAFIDKCILRWLVVDRNAAKALWVQMSYFYPMCSSHLYTKPAVWVWAPETSRSPVPILSSVQFLLCTKHPTSSAEADKEKSIGAKH